MSNQKLLSPDTIPKPSGIKRVNNVPLIMALGILLIFLIMIAFVAQKRARLQQQQTGITKTSQPNAMHLAYAMLDEQQALAKTNPHIAQAKITHPVLLKPEPDHAAQKLKMQQEIIAKQTEEKLNQEKLQAYEAANQAKTSVSLEQLKISQPQQAALDLPASFHPELPKQSMPNPLGGYENDARWLLNTAIQNPSSRYELRAGSVIPGVMISGISSELPGQIIGQVSQNVYDTATGKYLVIPQGTKLIGVYANHAQFGQNAVLIAWQRLIFPDGKALDIGAMPGADQSGYAGFKDQVNHHYARIYGSALLMSGIVAGIAYSQNQNQTHAFGDSTPNASSVLSQALGQQLGQVTTQMVAKNLNLSPTIHIRPGYRFNVIVTKDLVLGG